MARRRRPAVFGKLVVKGVESARSAVHEIVAAAAKEDVVAVEAIRAIVAGEQIERLRRGRPHDVVAGVACVDGGDAWPQRIGAAVAVERGARLHDQRAIAVHVERNQ